MAMTISHSDPLHFVRFALYSFRIFSAFANVNLCIGARKGKCFQWNQFIYD